MSPVITYTLVVILIAYALIILVELMFVRNFKRFVLEGMILLGVIVLLNVTTGFPVIRQSFGGVSPTTSVVIIFFCAFGGITAQHLFYLEGKFRWREYLKPMLTSPIVLLPLLGAIQRSSNLESVQLISLGFLAFQNGFFWKEMFKRAKRYI